MPCSPGPRGAQSTEGLARHSAFKPVVPSSFHSMQNLVSAPQSGEVCGHGEDLYRAAFALEGLKNQESPEVEAGCSSGGLSESGKNSLTSLPTYTGLGWSSGPSHTLGPLRASTSHINRLGITTQNGLSISDSKHSSCSSQWLNHPDNKVLPLQTSPSCVDIIQDPEEYLWDREQEVFHKSEDQDKSEDQEKTEDQDNSEVMMEQVLEEKQRAWEREMDELRQTYAGQLQQVSHRALCSQHALQKQLAQLQQDKRRLQDEITAVLAHHKELEKTCMDYKKLHSDILPKLEESKWEVCQKTGEIFLLKQQLRDSQGEVIQRVGETAALRAQLKELSAQLKDKEDMADRLKGSCGNKSLQLEHCKQQLQRTQTEAANLRDRLVVTEAEIHGLKHVLSEHNREAGNSCRVLPSAQSPSQAMCPPPGLGLDPLLSLQSDEAKVLWQQEDIGDQKQEQKAIGLAQEQNSRPDEEQYMLQYLEQQMEQLSTTGQPSSRSSPQTSPEYPLSDMKLPAVYQQMPTWPAATYVDKIQSTEI